MVDVQDIQGLLVAFCHLFLEKNPSLIFDMSQMSGTSCYFNLRLYFDVFIFDKTYTYKETMKQSTVTDLPFEWLLSLRF